MIDQPAPEDRPVDHDDAIARYNPEMKRERDEFVERLKSLRRTAIDAKDNDALPPRVFVNYYPGNTVTIDFNGHSDNFSEALEQAYFDKLTSEDPENPSYELMVVTFFGTSEESPEDTGLPTVETPRYKVDWSTMQGTDTISNTVAIYDDGFVESSSMVTRSEMVHRPDATDLELQYAAPTIKQETTLYSAGPLPAEQADVQNAVLAIQQYSQKYGLNF